MNSHAAAFFAPKALLTLAVVAVGFLAGVSQAQQVYRVVGPDGKVTFSDRAPAVSGANVSADFLCRLNEYGLNVFVELVKLV